MIEYQKSLIEDLARSNQDYIRKFESLKLGIRSTAKVPEEAIQSHGTGNGIKSRRAEDIYGCEHKENRDLKGIETANVNAKDLHINANFLGVSAPPVFERAEQAEHGQTVEPRNDTLMSHLKHYLSLVNNLLDEVDKAKYEIRSNSRDGIRRSISQAYQREMRPLVISTQTSEALLAKDQLAPLIAGVQRRLEQAVCTEIELLDLQRSPDTSDEQFQMDFQPELGILAAPNDSRIFEDDLDNGDVLGSFDSLSSWEGGKNEHASYDASGFAYDTYQDPFYRNASPPATMNVADALAKPAEEKDRRINPMSGYEVNEHGQIIDEGGELIGLVTAGQLSFPIGCRVDDNGYVVDTEGNRMGECTLMADVLFGSSIDPGPSYSYRRALWMGPSTGSVADELLALWTLLPRR